MAEGRRSRKGSTARGASTRSAGGRRSSGRMANGELHEEFLLEDESMNSRSANSRSARSNPNDPIERIAQLYYFLRSPQVELTVRKFVASRKTRQLIAAGIGVLEVVVVLLPLLRKLGSRVADLAALAKQPSRVAARTPGSGSSRSLAAPSGSIH